MLRREFSRLLIAGSTVAGSTLALSPAQLMRGLVAQDRAPAAARTDAGPKVARGGKCAAATVHPLATQAAMDAFARGGNAVDAAVAASLMLSVVDGHNSGLGGGGLALVRMPDGKVMAFDGRERAPLAVQPSTFLRDGKPDPTLSQTGPLAAATPGLPALLDRLASTCGALKWQESLLGAAEIAERGFAIDRIMARNIAETAKTLSRFPESARVLLDASGAPLAEGAVLRQSDLARTLRMLAEQGSQWFYAGEFAERTEKAMQSMGGLLARRDFAEYTVEQRETIECSYRGHQVFGFPPPSSGGIHVAQMLGMLARFDVRGLFESSPATGYHLLAEVMKRAMADRAYWLGDADFAEVPRGLIDLDYLAERSRDIDLERSTTVASHGQPPRATEELFEDKKHTTHLTTADASGMVVALTQTINTSFGSKVIVPGTGVMLNNEMDDFSLAPGVRNAFGLVGSAANAVAPGKRPLSSMSPSIVVGPDGQWRLTCGAAGGPKITTTTLQSIVRALDLDMPIEAALAAPRIHHQWSPDTLSIEKEMPAEIAKELERRGHKVASVTSLAVAQGIGRSATGELTAASDPRVPSQALAK